MKQIKLFKDPSFHFAFIKTLPIAVSYFMVSLAFGILIGQAGFSWLWSWGISWFIYTGAFQFVLASFMTAGASLATVALTALFMNSRQLFYGLGFIDDFKKTGKWYPYMIHTLTDETYALYNSIETYPSEVDKPKAQRYIAMLARVYWMAGAILGAWIGNAVPFQIQGVDFTLTSLFLTIVIDQWKAAGSRIPSLIGFASGIVFLILLGKDRFILPALILASGILILYSSVLHRKGEVK